MSEDPRPNLREGEHRRDGGSIRDRWARKHALLLYFLLAFALSWSLWPLVLANPTAALWSPSAR